MIGSVLVKCDRLRDSLFDDQDVIKLNKETSKHCLQVYFPFNSESSNNHGMIRHSWQDFVIFFVLFCLLINQLVYYYYYY